MTVMARVSKARHSLIGPNTVGGAWPKGLFKVSRQQAGHSGFI